MRRPRRIHTIFETLSDGRWVTYIVTDHTFWAIHYRDKLIPPAPAMYGEERWYRCKARFDDQLRLHNEHGPAVWIPDA